MYYLRHKDIVIGMFSGDGKSFTHCAESSDEGDVAFPFGLYPLDKNSKTIRPHRKHNPTEKDIVLWLSSRVFPKERHGALGLLNSLDLSYYDPWEIAKKTRGISLDDSYWFSADINDKFEDIHPLAIVKVCADDDIPLD